jgi:hypothetical protein
VFSHSIDQTYTFTVLGETSDLIAADETIVIHVPLTDMNKLLSYSSSWLEEVGSTGQSGVQPLPAVTLRLATVVGAKLDALSDGLKGATLGDSYTADAMRAVVTGDESSSCATLLKQFQEISGFTYHDNAAMNPAAQTNYLADIPVEAIKKFETSPLVVSNIPVIVGGDLVAVPAPGETGTADKVATPVKAALQSLFEQAVQAGMVTKGSPGADLQAETITSTGFTNLGSVEAATVAGTSKPVYGVQWAAGQSLGFYVRYNLTKKRTFVLDSEAGTTNARVTNATKVTFGGVEFDINGDTEESTAVPKTYQIVLKVAAVQQ